MGRWGRPRTSGIGPQLPTVLSLRQKLLWNKYWVDEIYDTLIVRPLKYLSTNIFLNISDKKLIDGFADGSASGWRKVSSLFSNLQTGNIQAYGFYMIVGIAVAVFIATYIF